MGEVSVEFSRRSGDEQNEPNAFQTLSAPLGSISGKTSRLAVNAPEGGKALNFWSTVEQEQFQNFADGHDPMGGLFRDGGE